MKTHSFNRHFRTHGPGADDRHRTDACLSAPHAISGQPHGNTDRDGRNMNCHCSTRVHSLRLDGVAASLVTRPVASLTSAERRDLADRYNDRIIASQHRPGSLRPQRRVRGRARRRRRGRVRHDAELPDAGRNGQLDGDRGRPADPPAPAHPQPSPVVPGQRGAASLRKPGVCGGRQEQPGTALLVLGRHHVQVGRRRWRRSSPATTSGTRRRCCAGCRARARATARTATSASRTRAWRSDACCGTARSGPRVSASGCGSRTCDKVEPRRIRRLRAPLIAIYCTSRTNR